MVKGGKRKGRRKKGKWKEKKEQERKGIKKEGKERERIKEKEAKESGKEEEGKRKGKGKEDPSSKNLCFQWLRSFVFNPGFVSLQKAQLSQYYVSQLSRQMGNLLVCRMALF